MAHNDPLGYFSDVGLSDTLERMPIKYGFLRTSGLFGKAKGLTGRVAPLEIVDRKFNILTSKPVGSIGDGTQTDTRTLKHITVPHFPIDDVVLPDDVEGLRRFGGSIKESLAQFLSDKLREHRDNMDITIEYMQAGAIKGQVVDGGGNVLLDLLSEFGVTQPTAPNALNSLSIELPKYVNDISRLIRDRLQGEVSTGVLFLCSRSFIDQVYQNDGLTEESIRKGKEGLGMFNKDMYSSGISVAGAKFIEYDAVDPVSGDTFIPEGEAFAIPMGTRDTFCMYAAPADFNESVGKLGKMFYSKKMPRRMGRGYDLHSQFNLLPIVKRPETIVKCAIS